MGRERTPAGKFLYFFSAGLIFFLLTGFTASTKESASSSRQEASPPKVSTQKEPAKRSAEDLSRAKKLFDMGNYVAALEENQRILSRSAKNGPRDQALFNIGLIYACVENPQRNSVKALQFFNAVLKEYPQSPLTGEARVLAGVLQEKEKLSQVVDKFKHENEELNQAVEKFKRENKELSKVIEKFKQVDIDVEGKKREQER